MVGINKYLNKVLPKISLYGVAISILSLVTFYFTNIHWSHFIVILFTTFLFNKNKVNINYLTTFGVFYILGLIAVHRYDFDKFSEIMFYQFIPLIICLIFFYNFIYLDKLVELSKYISNIFIKCRDFLKKRIHIKNKNLLGYIYIAIALLFSYTTIFIFQGFMNIYGGLIVLFLGFLISKHILSEKKQLIFIYTSITLYVLIYNLTLTHGITLLIEQPKTYLYIYSPSILIPYLFAYSKYHYNNI